MQHFPGITGVSDIFEIFRGVDACILYKDLFTTGMLNKEITIKVRAKQKTSFVNLKLFC
jgi:hypothetical protein